MVPSTLGPEYSTNVGQRGVNLIAFEIGVSNVLAAMMQPHNIGNTAMWPIMANQFMQLLEGNNHNLFNRIQDKFIA